MADGQQPFTVILLVPDYAASTFGQDIFTAHASGADRNAAIADAQRQAEEAYPHHDIEDPSDFHPLATFKGHLNPDEP